MAGIMMYPNTMKVKTKAMLEQLEQLEPYAEAAYKALGMVQMNCFYLMGAAWDNVREYMREIQQPLMQTCQLWLKSQKEATSAYHMAALCLPNVNCLDEDRLETEKSNYERWLDREYNREDPNYSRIRRYRRMIREIDSKLEAMSMFIRVTRRMYDRPAELLSILEKADTQLSGVGIDPVTGLINYTSVDYDWLFNMQEKLSDDYLKKLGISIKQIVRMKELGLSSGELKAAYESLKTEEDKEFFCGMFNETFRTTFQIDPNQLSMEAKFFLTKYTRMMLDKGKVDELRDLINEMLYTDPDHPYYPNRQNKQAYGMEYIDILFEASSCILEEEGKLILASKGILTEDGMDRLSKNMRELADLNVLWGSISNTAFREDYFYESGIESISMRLMYGSRIEDLEYQGSGFKYNVMYSTAWIKDSSTEAEGNNVYDIEWHKDNLLEVNTSINTDLNAMNDQEYRETLRNLEKQKEELWMKYVINTGTGIVGALCPKAGLVYGLLAGISEGNAGKVGDKSYVLLEKSGIIKPEVMKCYKAGGKSAVIAATGLLDYFDEKQRLDGQISGEHARMKLEWFGATSSFQGGELTETVNAGFYNVTALEELRDWEENGLISVAAKVIEDDKKIDALIKNLKEHLIKTGQYNETVKTVMEGGDIMGLDTEQFVKAVEDINKAYENVYADRKKKKIDGPCGGKLNIQAIFQMSVPGKE